MSPFETQATYFLKRIIEGRQHIPKGSESIALDELVKEAKSLHILADKQWAEEVMGKPFSRKAR